MHPHLEQTQTKSLLDDTATLKKLSFNFRKNKEQDHTSAIDACREAFQYEHCRDEYWNPENLSLLYATPIWHQSSQQQRILLNQLYWVAYYNQIISAEIATIFFNQISATGLYALEDFRIVCDTLDLESAQERAHIHAFKSISEDTEWHLFKKRLFTYPMRGPFSQTMIFADRGWFKDLWRKYQLKAYAHIAPENAFLASQYLLIRGLRTLNGKLIQHKLAKDVMCLKDKSSTNIPAQISYYHFMDESFHFNTSKLVGLEIPRLFKPPTRYEKWVINQAVKGCQKDHSNFSVVVNGLFWYEPALYSKIYQLLRSSWFHCEHQEALQLMHQSFCQENEAQHLSHQLQKIAIASYQSMVAPLQYLSKTNREMQIMQKSSISHYLKINRQHFKKFKANEALHHYLRPARETCVETPTRRQVERTS